MPYIALATLAVSAYQTYKSSEDKKKAQDALGKLKHINYQVSPELRGAYDRAQQMARFGYTPQEKAALRQNVAQDINTNQQRALDQGGGNLARIISRMGSIANIQSENQMAMADAGLRRQNIRYADSLGSQIQGINNMATGEDISQYNMAQRAYGQAAAQQQENIYRGLGTMAYMGGSYANSLKKNPPTVDNDPYTNPALNQATARGFTSQNNVAFDARKNQGYLTNPSTYGQPREQDYYRFGF